jgi:phage baseplate assembly protein V
VYRIGIVTQIDVTKAKARVRFPDMDNVTSYWLAVLNSKTLKDKTYWMPDINEHVVCLLDAHGEEGVILGAIYSEADQVPVSSKDKKHITFEDGTIIEYDRAEKVLKINTVGTINIVSVGNIIITSPEINYTGNLNVIGNITASGTIIDSSGNTNHHVHS